MSSYEPGDPVEVVADSGQWMPAVVVEPNEVGVLCEYQHSTPGGPFRMTFTPEAIRRRRYGLGDAQRLADTRDAGIEEGRRLASERDDLITSGVDPDQLAVPFTGPAPIPLLGYLAPLAEHCRRLEALFLEDSLAEVEQRAAGEDLERMDRIRLADEAELLRAAIAYRDTARAIVMRLEGDAAGKPRDGI